VTQFGNDTGIPVSARRGGEASGAQRQRRGSLELLQRYKKAKAGAFRLGFA